MLEPNINFIYFDPTVMTVTLCLSCSLRCSTRGLGVHSIGAFPRAPSVECGLPYRIWSLLSGSLLATASGVSEVPLGRVWPFLPHLVSNPLRLRWQLLWDPNSTELNNNSTPTRSHTGSLKSNV